MLFRIDSSSSGQRVDRFLKKAFPRAPLGELYKLFRQKDVKRNGKRIGIQEYLEEGDELFVYLSAEREEAWGPENVRLQEGDLHILYEDQEDLVVYKESGLKTTPDHVGEDCLSLRVQAYLKEACTRTFRPSPLGRLDKDTQGLVLFAKNYQRSKELQELQRQGAIKKLYLALIFGTIKEGLCELAIEKKKDQPGVRLSDEGKVARTFFRILDEKKPYQLVEAQLLTGRTHQIRASIQALGGKILGDELYGRGKGGQKLLCYQLLWDKKEVHYLSPHFRKEIRKVGLDEARADSSGTDTTL